MFLAVLMITLLLTGCTVEKGQEEQIKEYYTDVERFSAQVRATTVYPDKDYVFRFDYDYSRDEADLLVLTAPETVAGIEIAVNPDGTQIAHSGQMFETGSLGGRISTVGALDFVLGQVKTGYLTSKSKEKINGRPGICLGYTQQTQEQTIETKAYFIENRLVKGEIYIDGGRAIELELA